MAKGKLWIILLIAAIIIAASVVVYMKKTQPLEDLTQQYENIIRLTHSQDNYRTVWSPDGSKIFFLRSDISFLNSSVERGKSYIYVMDSDGSNQKRLAEGMDIALSPDGSKVFFYREKQDNGWELWVMNADGNNLQKLSQVNADSIEDLRNPESGIRLYSWGSDRKNIIFYTTKRVFSDYPWIQNEDGTLEKGTEIGTRKYGEIISTLWIWNVDGEWSKARKIISSKPLT